MRNFAEFTREHQCRNLFFDKVKLCRSSTSSKASLQRSCFLVNFAKFVRVRLHVIETKSHPGMKIFLFIRKKNRLKRLQKNPTHPFVDISKQKTYAKFQPKILNCEVVGARQNFQIFRQNIWFLENNRTLSNFFYEILHY